MASTAELAQTTDISSLYLGRDPNEKTNRVPTELELKGLRALAVSNSHIAEFLDGEVEKLQASHKVLSDRLLQQQRELEATQSQLCVTKKLLDSLQDQRSAVKSQMEELRGLMHPVRRLPVELLRAIFEAAMDVAKSKLEMAVRLSHVCRLWRDIALDAPRLWSQVTLSPFAKSDSFWAEIIPRMKTIPATVHVQGITRDHFPLLQKWHLSKIPNLESLMLEFPPTLATQPICGALFSPPYIPLKELTILQDDDAVGDLLYNVQHGQFPSLLTLIINGNGSVSLYSSPSPTITTLVLNEVDDVDMEVVLRFGQLETLKLIRVTFVEPISLEGLMSPSLLSLHLEASPLFQAPWVAALKFPELYSLHNDDYPNDLFVAFVVSHPTLELLNCAITTGQLTAYAAAIPGISTLYLAPPFEEFINWKETGMSNAPFPSLRVLVVALATTFADFEALVCTRCLPLDHPRSRLEPSILPLDELRVVMESNVWADAPLAQHELAQSASVEVIPYILEDNLYCAVLRWQSSTQLG